MIDEKIIREVREAFSIPAIAVAVVHADKHPEIAIQGVRIAGEKSPVTEHDFFHIGSCSKSVLAVMAAKQVEQGRMRWDQSFFEVFPELRKGARPEYLDCTLERLLLCRAGIAAFTDLNADPIPQFGPVTSNPATAFLQALLSRPPVTPPTKSGFAHRYSNASYSMASAMIERVTGHTYSENIQLTLVDTLGLSAWIGWPNVLSPEQPWGHQLRGGKAEPFPPDHPYRLPACLAPAGDLSMPVTDIARYAQWHLRGLMGKETLLSAETFRRLHFGYDGFSLGIGNGRWGGLRFSGIDGSAGTFFCRALFVPERNAALCIMMNAGTGTADMPAMEKITMKLAKRTFNGWWKWWL
ncbi:MAG TPA: serine hydrolase domain-containing protein [Kiritimatiellia bacterium]|nr:serine hydrolase domain-containing protein [Kiritimatiellia bacterium]HMO99769.1 serine hydrolase domain-containing protein [Kiritimatiellia bacterium]HMP97100.1 serine hydrolase domain-containing protein [Kiritimatiellia bacterium]